MKKKIKKIVLPVAGLGKRLRPLTLTTPKNLVPLRGRPILEYTLDEAKAAGIEDVIIVISPEHEEKYNEYLKTARVKYPELNFHLRKQAEPLGDGHAVLQAKDLLGDEPFLVRFCDDVIMSEKPSLVSLIEAFGEGEAPALFLERVPREEVYRYGVVAAEPTDRERIHKIKGSVEKPKVEEAPSDLIIIGGYALTPEVLRDLEEMEKDMIHEHDALRLNHAFMKGFKEGRHMYGLEFEGTRLDCGTLDGLKAAEEFLEKYLEEAKA